MTAFDGVRRQRTRTMIVANIVALALAAGAGLLGVAAIRDYKGATKVSAQARELPETPIGMLATVDADDRLVSTTLFVLKPSQVAPGDNPGGSILSVPVSIDTTLGIGETRIPLTESYATGGATGLQFALESALTISLDVMLVADEAGAVAALASIGDDAAALAAETLVAPLDGQLERDRRAEIEGVWSEVSAIVGNGLLRPPSPTSPLGMVATLDDIFSQLLAGPVATRGLLTSPIAAADNPAGKDVEALDRGDAVLVLASIAGASVSTPAPGMHFRIEAPVGYDDRVKVLVLYLLAMGANVKSIYLQAPARADSVMYIGEAKYIEQLETQGYRIADIASEEPTEPIAGIDVILVLGTDYLDAIDVNDPEYLNPSTTTTTTVG